jgi:hypothetical protein
MDSHYSGGGNSRRSGFYGLENVFVKPSSHSKLPRSRAAGYAGKFL